MQHFLKRVLKDKCWGKCANAVFSRLKKYFTERKRVQSIKPLFSKALSDYLDSKCSLIYDIGWDRS